MRRGLQVVFPNVEGGVRRDHDRDIWKDGYREKKGLRRKYLGYVEDGIWGQVRVKK